jgi:hypothetical protein
MRMELALEFRAVVGLHHQKCGTVGVAAPADEAHRRALIAGVMTRHRLIDEYQFGVVPIILGKGRRLLDDLEAPRTLSLIESRQFPTGTVLLRYAAAP